MVYYRGQMRALHEEFNESYMTRYQEITQSDPRRDQGHPDGRTTRGLRLLVGRVGSSSGEQEPRLGFESLEESGMAVDGGSGAGTIMGRVF